MQEEVQLKLEKEGNKIKIKSNIPIDLELYPNLFKYKIYECYKPENL